MSSVPARGLGSVLGLAAWLLFPAVAVSASSVGFSVGPAVVDLRGHELLDEAKFEAGTHFRWEAISNPSVSIRSGILYRTLGSYLATGFYADEIHRTGYISVPLEIELEGPGRDIRPLLGVGASFDLLVRARTRGAGMYAIPDRDVRDEYRKVHWSAVGTVGVSVGQRWTVRFRGSHGLSELLREPNGLEKSRSIAFEVGFWIPT